MGTFYASYRYRNGADGAARSNLFSAEFLVEVEIDLPVDVEEAARRGDRDALREIVRYWWVMAHKEAWRVVTNLQGAAGGKLVEGESDGL